ncbi:MAG: hypothetical protein GYA58_04840 [Anaerolineaceae bacterium]|nr:hypothetical protein [Anaerolineaceae bacterium]
MGSATNITEVSFTFPIQKIDNEIVLDSKIRDIEGKFLEGNEKIILIAPSGSGKTVLLRQFCQMNSDNCISYFFTDNYWTKQPPTFLTSLLKQISCFLKTNEEVEEQIDYEKQKRVFSTLIQRVFDNVKREKRKCFFVFDNLEAVLNDSTSHEFIDLINIPTSPSGIYLLGSIDEDKNKRVPFQYLKETPHYFSLVETEKYFKDTKLDDADIKTLQNWSSGVPGILYLAKDMVLTGSEAVSKIVSEKTKIDSLIECQWNGFIKNLNEEQRSIFPILAYSLTPLSLDAISSISELDNGQVSQVVNNNNFISISTNNEYFIYPEIYKTYIKNKYSKQKGKAIDLLIKYYESLISQKHVKDLLTEYYLAAEKSEEIKALITPDYISESIISENNFSLVTERLNEAIDLMIKKNSISAVGFEILNSQLHEISDQLFGVKEIEALISLKKFDSALDYAYSTRIITTRIRLLCKVLNAKQQNGEILKRESIDEIVSEIHKLNTSCISPELIIETAADVFPILPDEAIKLVDLVKTEEGDKSPLELFALLTSVRSESLDSYDLFNKIENEQIKDFAITHSPWLSKMSASDVIKKSKEASSTKAKEYILRQWCFHNKETEGLSTVIEAALDEMVLDSNYRISLRNIRQLSGFIKYCPQNSQEFLIKRFEVSTLQGILSPREEKTRLILNLLEVKWKIDSEGAKRELTDLFNELSKDDTVDFDVRCYCYARMYITARNINSPLLHDFIKELQILLKDDFIQILMSSANQFEITKNIIRSVAAVDIDLAIAFSDMLNTQDRREAGLLEVIKQYVGTEIGSIEKLKSALSKITNFNMKSQAAYEIIKSFCRKTCNSEDYLALSELASNVSDPYIKAKCFSELLDTTSLKEDDTYEKLEESLEQIDVEWLRIDCAFGIVTKLAGKHNGLAGKLFTATQSISRKTSFSNRGLGILYLDNLKIATQYYGEIESNCLQEKKEYLNELIDKFPSRVLKIQLYSRICISLYNSGNFTEAKALIENKIIAALNNYPVNTLDTNIFLDIGTALFLYDPHLANEWIQKLSYLSSNICLYKIAYRIITNLFFCENFDKEPHISGANFKLISDLLMVVEFLTRDYEIYMVSRMVTSALVARECKSISDAQKNTFLVKLEKIISDKLPDKKNISHEGYLVLILAEIAITKAKIKSFGEDETQSIIRKAENIDVIADRVLVLAELGTMFEKKSHTLGVGLIQKAYSQVFSIKNVSDRTERFEIIIESFSSIGNTTKAEEILREIVKLSDTLQGFDREKVLESVIQTSYALNQDIASELAEKIENPSLKYSLEIKKKAEDLSKSPLKISSYKPCELGNEILNEAALLMNRAISSNRAVTFPTSVLLNWILKIKEYNYSTVDQVIHWIIDSWIAQAANSEKKDIKTELFSSSLQICELLLKLGSNMSSMIKVPEDLKPNFSAYSLSRKYFRVGEEENAKEFINSWIKSNIESKDILLCDPYFDFNQLWILQKIPIHVNVKILCNGEKLGIKKGFDKDNCELRQYIKEQKRSLKNEFQRKWAEFSSQDPPPTLVIINNRIFDDDEVHDRFILGKDSGLTLGTSLNGFGNKEFSISYLSQADTQYTYSQIEPKLSIESQFSEVIYFESD